MSTTICMLVPHTLALWTMDSLILPSHTISTWCHKGIGKLKMSRSKCSIIFPNHRSPPAPPLILCLMSQGLRSYFQQHSLFALQFISMSCLFYLLVIAQSCLPLSISRPQHRSRSWSSSPRKYEKINVCCVSQVISNILLQQPEWNKTWVNSDHYIRGSVGYKAGNKASGPKGPCERRNNPR